MGIVSGLRSLFRKQPRRTLDDPDFGQLREVRNGVWESSDVDFWGCPNVHMLISAYTDGPTAEQRKFVEGLRLNSTLRERIENVVSEYAASMPKMLMQRKAGKLLLSTIDLPLSPSGESWRVLYDMEGEEIMWFGAEIKPTGEISAFAED